MLKDNKRDFNTKLIDSLEKKVSNYQSQNYEKNNELLEKVIKNSLRSINYPPKEKSRLYSIIGKCKFISGNLSAAIWYFKNSLMMDANEKEALTNLPDILLMNGDTKSALKYITHSLSIDPDYPPYLRNEVVYLAVTEQADKCIEKFKLLLSKSMITVDLCVKVATMLANSAKFNESNIIINEANKLYPANFQMESAVSIINYIEEIYSYSMKEHFFKQIDKFKFNKHEYIKALRVTIIKLIKLDFQDDIIEFSPKLLVRLNEMSIAASAEELVGIILMIVNMEFIDKKYIELVSNETGVPAQKLSSIFNEIILKNDRILSDIIDNIEQKYTSTTIDNEEDDSYE